ncbi:GNAT family N-acetyltransferase [Kiloniella litopenaei]|uniref:GNAT family N-acetyltransferase n=1 Tax=Kiloniella litopenaei TaxID=1549748 RepID=UPI003BA97B29
MLMDRPEAPSFDDLTLDDAPEIYNLIESLAWTHVVKDLEIMLEVGVFLGARDAEGNLVATGALFPYGKDLASIGMIMVSPESQKQGYGRAVMDALHNHEIAQGRTLCLVATEEGEPLYKKCGYAVAGRIRKFFGSSDQFLKEILVSELSTGLNDTNLRTMLECDLDKVIAMDAQAIGANRRRLFEKRYAQADYAVVAETQKGEVVGFLMATPQRGQHHLGPMVAPDSKTALAMIRYMAERSDKELRIDVPERQEDLHKQLPLLGFKLIANPHAMIRHQNVFPGCRERYWSLMSQAYA